MPVRECIASMKVQAARGRERARNPQQPRANLFVVPNERDAFDEVPPGLSPVEADAVVLHGLVRKLRASLERRRQLGPLSDETYEDSAAAVDLADGEVSSSGGILTRVFGKLFRAIDRPWKMYPLGFIFGLGFDTSSEIAILGIASIQAVQGTSIWLILIFPVLFTCTSPCLLIP
jgi:hypothetical protein